LYTDFGFTSFASPSHFSFQGHQSTEFFIMHTSSLLSVVALAATALGAPSSHVEKRAQTVYLAGDSTMARASGITTGTHCYASTHQKATTNHRD
jgi:hypothetical protein